LDGISSRSTSGRRHAVDATVTVVGAPLHHNGVAKGVPPSHTQPQSDEMGLHLGDAGPAADQLAALRPLTHRILDQVLLR
jgi:hypothetical protein